jgi:hypothetical protein
MTSTTNWDSNGRCYGGGEFASILGWRWDTPLPKVVAELLRRQKVTAS